jgi:CheY-like chemotaxis protein
MAVVLVVDDVGSNRDLVCTVLHHSGHETVQATSAITALIALATTRADLVITDVTMRGANGYALARAIRANPATATIPVLFYTAEYASARAAGPTSRATPVLAKNGDVAALIEAIEDALSVPAA